MREVGALPSLRKNYICCDCDVSCILNCETPNLLYAVGAQCLGDLRCQQLRDPDCGPMLRYLECGDLLQEDRVVKKLILDSVVYELRVVSCSMCYQVRPYGPLSPKRPGGSSSTRPIKTHAGTFGAHQRTEKIHAILSKHYWWPAMRKVIKAWCQACEACFTRAAGPPPHIPLTPIPVAGSWDRVVVDMLQLPRSQSGNQYLVVFIDYLTKWVEAFPTHDQTALTIARLLIEEIVPRHGTLRTLLLDRGANFLSKLMAEIYRLLGVRKLNTAAYHPQSDGLAEHFHRTITNMMAKSGRDKRAWDIKLPYLLFAYRAAKQDSTWASPFQLLYG